MLLPPYLDKNCKSSGERMVFDILKQNEFTKDWIVLHSLNLSQHVKRLYGEIDFLLLIPNGGIYVMEVKGGDVKCVNGVWYYKDRFNNTHTSNIGPFNQARDAMFSLKAAIEKEFGKGHKLTRVLTGFVCAFPHIQFDIHSVEFESWQILDKDSIHVGLEDFFTQLINHYIQKYIGQRWFSVSESLPTLIDLFTLRDFLRGDFEKVRTIKDKLGEFDKQVKSYTAEQYRVLDHIQQNDRCLIQGSAGTGKTMIALESAVRASQGGKKVFLTCFNRLIGEWMSSQLKDYRNSITVCSLHAFLFEESRGFDYDQSQVDKQDFYTKYIPQLLTDIYNKGLNEKFDQLIIDEGQDLIREEYLRLFDSMLKGGMSDGQWEIYGDFEKQAIYSTISKEKMLSQVDKTAYSSKFFLKTNCRNTKQIGEETSLISGFISPPYLLEFLEGIPVEYVFYENSIEQVEILEHQLSKLSGNGLPANEIVILSPKKLENSCSNSVSGFNIKEINHISELYSEHTYFRFATIHSFKGLESNYILITDIDDLSSERAKSLLYTGMSRARYGLILLIAETERNLYREILKNKLS